MPLRFMPLQISFQGRALKAFCCRFSFREIQPAGHGICIAVDAAVVRNYSNLRFMPLQVLLSGESFECTAAGSPFRGDRPAGHGIFIAVDAANLYCGWCRCCMKTIGDWFLPSWWASYTVNGNQMLEFVTRLMPLEFLVLQEYSFPHVIRIMFWFGVFWNGRPLHKDELLIVFLPFVKLVFDSSSNSKCWCRLFISRTIWLYIYIFILFFLFLRLQVILS